MSRATIMKLVIIGAVLVVVFVGIGMVKGKKSVGNSAPVATD